jgi:hypothetical protein
MDERHLTDERLLELACGSDREHVASSEEDAHLENCTQCLSKLVDLVKKFNDN